MERGSLWGVVLVGMVCISTALQAAERRPWPRRAGVVLVQDKESGALQTLGRTQAASMGVISAASLRTEEELAEALLKTGRYAFAEPDYLMSAAVAPNDPNYSLQWFHPRIRSAEAWDITTGAPSVMVAVLDTGVDVNHPDLASNMQLPGFNVVNQNTDIRPVAEHGTWVAGLIGAVGNNAIGVSGMGWSVKILPVRITNNADTTAWCSDMAQGITWAADHGAQIINLSYNILGCPRTMDAASRYARTKGALVFIAAGNEGVDVTPYVPSGMSFQMIGATNETDKRASFSNYGRPISLVAPGARMITTAPGGDYVIRDGTSFATPLVSGLAALIRAYHPTFSPDEVMRIINATARSGPEVDGQGRIDAGAALASAKQWADTGVWIQPAKLTVEGAEANVPNAVVSNGSAVRVYPNPWRADRHGRREMTFDQMSGGDRTVKIFTVSGHLVKELTVTAGETRWDMTTESGDLAASGLYIYLASGDTGVAAKGKLAIIR